jgi:hypothetical protein
MNHLQSGCAKKNALNFFTARMPAAGIFGLAISLLFLACRKAPEPQPLPKPIEVNYLEVNFADLRDKKYEGKNIVVKGYLRLESGTNIQEFNGTRSAYIRLKDKPLSRDTAKKNSTKEDEFRVIPHMTVGDDLYNMQMLNTWYSPYDLKVRTSTKIVGPDDLVNVYASVSVIYPSACNLLIEKIEPVDVPPTEGQPEKAKKTATDAVKKISEKKSVNKEKR